MQKTIYTAFLFGFWCFVSLAQTSNGILKVIPDNLEFTSKFNRITDVQFINTGNTPLMITNINYKKPELYYIRFDQYGNYPLTIPPNDTVHMDCILAGYYFVSQQDSLDTMFVFNNGVLPVQKITIKIDFFEANLGLGSINGNVKEYSSGLPVANAHLHFLLGGNYFINSAYSDNFGNYSVQLPPGNYIVAAEKDSFYTTFFGGKFDPFTSSVVHVGKDSVSTANINFNKMNSTYYSISGKILDAKSQGTLNRAVVIIRQGTHTPGKIRLGKQQDTIPTQSYSVFADAAGNYNFQNIPQSGYYFIQSFSEFYIPGYYSQSGPSPVFWQQTDSVQINTALTNKNISMQRDSSTGGGIISGLINTGSIIPDIKIVVYAKSLNYNQPFTYAIPIQGNSFTVNNLPYGSYQLIGQLIGFPDALSGTVNITPVDTQITGINLNFNTSGVPEKPVIPQNVELYQNYPNPFNPGTTIQFRLPQSSFITLKIFNYIGQEIETLAKGYYNEGNYLVNWNAKNLASGIYFYTLNYNGQSYSRKMLLIK
jgi:hypothetical protein